MTTKLVYPIFLECCKYTQDNFWKYIFEDLAYKKTPYGIYIYCNYLCCNYKNKEFNYKIDITKDSKVLYNDIYNLFNKRFELLSEKDKINRKNLFEENSTNGKTKNINNVIYLYVINMKNKWNLPIHQTKKLLSYIILMSLFKVIIPRKLEDNYTICDNYIKFKKNNLIFKKNILENIATYSYSSSEINSKQKMSKFWNKYYQILSKSL